MFLRELGTIFAILRRKSQTPGDRGTESHGSLRGGSHRPRDSRVAFL